MRTRQGSAIIGLCLVCGQKPGHCKRPFHDPRYECKECQMEVSENGEPCLCVECYECTELLTPEEVKAKVCHNCERAEEIANGS